MSKNDEQLVRLIKDVVSGNKDKEAFCNEFYKEVYALIYPVFEDNSKKVASRAFIYLCDNLDKIDVNKNIHRQVATLVSTFMFGLIDKNTIKNNMTGLEYEFNKVKEDAELYNVIRDNVKIFRNPADYANASDSIRSLSRVQTILLELYGYEMHSVDEIEELLDMDSTFICEFLAKTKAQLLGIELETEESEYEEEDDSEDEYEADRYEEADEAEPDVLDYETEETDDDSESEDDEKSYFEDDDIDDDDSDEHPFRRTKAERNAAMRRADASNPVVRKLAGVVGKLFPSLSQAARRIVVYVTGGVILFAIVLSVFLSAVLSGNSKSTAKKNSNSNNIKVTTAETATSKEKATQAKTTKKADDTTAADNNAVEETTKADKSTNENTKSTTKAAVKEAEEETVEDSANGKEDGDNGQDEKETEPSTEADETKATEATTKVTDETEATEENTKATETTKATDETKTTEAVDNTAAAADVNTDNN